MLLSVSEAWVVYKIVVPIVLKCKLFRIVKGKSVMRDFRDPNDLENIEWDCDLNVRGLRAAATS
jgi:hypothetical protein